MYLLLIHMAYAVQHCFAAAQEEEDTILYEAHAKYGNKWAKISSMLPGRTDNQVKNHYYSTMRRTVRRIHREVSRPGPGEAQDGASPSAQGQLQPARCVLHQAHCHHTPAQHTHVYRRMEQVISQLSDADAVSFKACYEVLQQSLSGQANTNSILNSDLPKCVTSAITNPPARSKRRRQVDPPPSPPELSTQQSYDLPVSLPLPAPSGGGGSGGSAPPVSLPQLPGLVAGLPPLSSIGFHHAPLHAVWGHPMGMPLHAPSSNAPTAVMGPDGRLHLLSSAAASAHPTVVPGCNVFAAGSSNGGYSTGFFAQTAQLSGQQATSSTLAAPAATSGGPPPTKPKHGKKRRLQSMQIATDADLDPHKLANLIPQRTPGGSLVPLRKRAHTQLLLGLLSHRSQPTEQSRMASAAQAGRYTMHHGSAFSSSESGDEADGHHGHGSPASPASPTLPSAAAAGTTHASSSSMHGQYTAVDRLSNSTVQLQRTPAGALIQFVPPPLPSATGTQHMQLPGTPLDTIVQGLIHNANTLFTSQNAHFLAQLGLTPRGGNAEWDDVSSQSSHGKRSGQAASKFFPDQGPNHSTLQSSAHSASGLGGGGEPHHAPVAPLASPLTDSVFEVKAALPAVSGSMHSAAAASVAEVSHGGHPSNATGQQDLDIDQEAVLEFFALPPHLRTPTGLGALAAASSASGPAGYILRGKLQQQETGDKAAAAGDVTAAPQQAAHSRGAPSSSSGSDRNTVVTRVSSKSEELLAGTAALLGSHPKLRALMSDCLQLVHPEAPGAPGAAPAQAAATHDAEFGSQDERRDLLPSSTRTQQDVQPRSAGLASLLVSPRNFHSHMTPRLLTNTTSSGGYFFASTPHTGHISAPSSKPTAVQNPLASATASAHDGASDKQQAALMFDFS